MFKNIYVVKHDYWRVISLNKEEFSTKLVTLFPEKSIALKQHFDDYDQLLGHVFFADEINIPLCELFDSYINTKEIQKYCDFIENMWFDGDDDVQNIVDVTILERLSDDAIRWSRLKNHFTCEFIYIINDEIIKNNSSFHLVKPM